MARTFTLNYKGQKRPISPWVAVPILLCAVPAFLYAGVYLANIYITVVDHYLGIGFWWTALLLTLIFGKVTTKTGGRERDYGFLPGWCRSVLGKALVVLAIFTLYQAHEQTKLFVVLALTLILVATRIHRYFKGTRTPAIGITADSPASSEDEKGVVTVNFKEIPSK